MKAIDSRRADTCQRLERFRKDLKSAEQIVKDTACVYATGSFGRKEAGKNSDLDIFIVGRSNGKKSSDGKYSSQLRRLDEICLKAKLIELTRSQGIPEFSGDGRYLVHYSVDDFVTSLGKPEDDVLNTFTARLLLLLESCPLVGQATYNDVIENVVAAYWRDFEDHKATFIPAFLCNDILRLWRTFCVNYEARTARDPAEEKLKGKIKNYKLKHSRMLTCYSGILFLLSVYKRQETVTRRDAVDMVGLTPTERIQFVSKENTESAEINSYCGKLLEKYDLFLSQIDMSESELVQKFENVEVSTRYLDQAKAFGDTMFELMSAVGSNNKFHRLLVV